MNATRILIVAHPGANLDSLYAVLPALVDDVTLYHVTKYTDALAVITENQTHLVLIDSEIGFQEAKLTYELISSRFPQCKIIIFSDAAHWQRWKTISLSHPVLLKGFSTRRLKVTLSKALSGSRAAGVQPPL